MLATLLFFLLLGGSVTLVSASAGLFQRTAYASYAEGDLDRAVRQIRLELSSACALSVENSGLRIRYQTFNTNPGGTFANDASGKPVAGAWHTFEVRQLGLRPSGKPNYNLYWDGAGGGGLNGRPVLTSVSGSDPNPEAAGAVPYPVFALEAGTSSVVQVRLIASPTYGTGSGVRAATQRFQGDVTCRNMGP